MTSNHDKHIIECWLQLYGRLVERPYAVVDWPDKDSSKKNIDAICVDSSGERLAIEHTLIQPFEEEKGDAARFTKTLATLKDHPDLVQQGFIISASQPVGAIPTGIDWKEIANQLLEQLKNKLPHVPERSSAVTVKGPNWSIDVRISKLQTEPNDPGRFLPFRIWPGDPGPELIIRALEEKVPKLAEHAGVKKILLFEQDAIAGMTEDQFEQLPDDPQIRALLALIDEIWSAKTACLESEGVIFTNQIWPSIYTSRSSLNVHTGKLWHGPC